MIQQMVREHLDLDVITITGKTLGDNLEDMLRDNFFDRNLGYLHNYGLERRDVMVPVEEIHETGSVAVLKGNIAPEGAVVKYAAIAQPHRPRAGLQQRGGLLLRCGGAAGAAGGHPDHPL